MSIIACVVSTIISIFKTPFSNPNSCSKMVKKLAKVSGCCGMVTFGNITTKLSGNFPPVSFTKVLTNRSKVRNPRSFISSVNGLIRMPIKGESVFSCMPLATSLAVATAVASSSSLLRLPYPSSKSIRKSSIASDFNLATTLS